MSIVRFRDWQEPENRTMKLQESKDLRPALRPGLLDYLTHEPINAACGNKTKTCASARVGAYHFRVPAAKGLLEKLKP